MGNIRENKENGGVVLSAEEQARLDEISKQYTQSQADEIVKMAENNAKQGKSIEEQENKLEEVVAKEAREKAIEYYKSKNFSPELIEQISTDYKTDDPQILDKRQEFDKIVEKFKGIILTRKLKIIQRTIEESPIGRFEKMLKNVMWKKGMLHVNSFNSASNQQKEVDKMLEKER